MARSVKYKIEKKNRCRQKINPVFWITVSAAAIKACSSQNGTQISQDNQQIIELQQYEAFFTENSNLDAFYTERVNDGQQITSYQIDETSQQYFEIVPLVEGFAIKFIDSPNYENLFFDGQYFIETTFTVRQSQGQDQQGEVTYTKTVAVRVENVDDPPLFVQSDGVTPTTADIVVSKNENIEVGANGEVIYTARATDEDNNDNAITYELDGNSQQYFTITVVEGGGAEIRFKASPDYETPFDAAGLDGVTNSHTLTIIATSAGKQSVQRIVVNIDNVDDNEPFFVQSDGVTPITADIVVNKYENIEAGSNGEVIHTAYAVDADGDSVTYSLDGVSEQYFIITVVEGGGAEIRFKTSPDYETPFDADDADDAITNSHRVIITATSGDSGQQRQSVQRIVVNIDNVDDNEPFFVQSDGFTPTTADIVVNKNENIEAGANGEVIHTAYAVDADGDSIAYSLDEVSEQYFIITVVEGGGAEIRFKTSPDYETPFDAAARDGTALNSHTFVISATTSSGISIEQTVTVNVDNVDDNEPFFVQSDGVTPITADIVVNEYENIEAGSNGEVIYIARAIDADGDSVTYSLDESSQQYFTITVVEGGGAEIRFKTSPDYETPFDAAVLDGVTNSHTLTIIATSAGKQSVQRIVVNIDNVDDNEPFFVQSDGVTPITADIVVNEYENIEAGANGEVLYTALAVDADGDSIAYSLDEVSEQYFIITVVEGGGAEIRFKASPDYENPFDADDADDAITNSRRVIITATSGESGQQRQSIQQIVVNIDNVDDNEPFFVQSDGVTPTTADIVVNKDENIRVGSNGEVIYIARAIDADGDSVTYSLDQVSEQYFIITIVQGVGAYIRFEESPDYETPFDAAARDGTALNSHTFVISATTSSGISTEQTVTVNVDNVDDAPIFSSLSSVSFVADGINDDNEIIYIAQAEDQDDPLVYEIDQAAFDGSFFRIDSALGHVRLAQGRVITITRDYRFNVIAKPVGAEGRITTTKTVTLSVFLSNVPTSALVFDLFYSDTDDEGAALVAVGENLNINDILYEADAQLVNNPTEPVTYSLGQDDDYLYFTIDRNSGEIRFVSTPDYENPFQRQEGESLADANNYRTTVLAAASGQTASLVIKITVQNLPLVFDIQGFEIDADGSILMTFVEAVEPPDQHQQIHQGNLQDYIFTITARDSDSDAEILITYEIDEASQRYFTLTTNQNGSAEIGFISLPDYENPFDEGDNEYNIHLTATNGAGQSKTQQIKVTVQDGDDAPVITSIGSVYFVTHDDNDHERQIYLPRANDQDNDTIRYSIANDDNDIFRLINQQLKFKQGSVPIFDINNLQNNVYSVTIIASSQGDSGVVLTDRLNLAVNIIGEDNNAPVFISDEKVYYFQGRELYRALAADADGDTISYSTTNGYFNIGLYDGILEFTTQPDYYNPPAGQEPQNTYHLTITAASTGSAGISKTADRQLAVTVVNPDEPLVFTSGNKAVFVGGTDIETTLYTAAVVDGDSMIVAYDIENEAYADARFFQINEQTGKLTFKQQPDYLLPQDEGADNVYNIVVFALSGTKGAFIEIEIVVVDPQDYVDTAPQFDVGQAIIDINEITKDEIVAQTYELPHVYSSSASDIDGDIIKYSLDEQSSQYFKLTYSFEEGNPNPAGFSIHFIEPPDYEEPFDAGGGDGIDNHHVITVTAESGPGGAKQQAIQEITVDLHNLSDPPVFLSGNGVDEIVFDPGVLTYSLGDSTVGGATQGDEKFFTIDSQTGVVRLYELMPELFTTRPLEEPSPQDWAGYFWLDEEGFVIDSLTRGDPATNGRIRYNNVAENEFYKQLGVGQVVNSEVTDLIESAKVAVVKQAVYSGSLTTITLAELSDPDNINDINKVPPETVPGYFFYFDEAESGGDAFLKLRQTRPDMTAALPRTSQAGGPAIIRDKYDDVYSINITATYTENGQTYTKTKEVTVVLQYNRKHQLYLPGDEVEFSSAFLRENFLFISSSQINIGTDIEDAQRVYQASATFILESPITYSFENPAQGDARYFDIDNLTGEVTFNRQGYIDAQAGNAGSLDTLGIGEYQINIIARLPEYPDKQASQTVSIIVGDGFNIHFEAQADASFSGSVNFDRTNPSLAKDFYEIVTAQIYDAKIFIGQSSLLAYTAQAMSQDNNVVTYELHTPEEGDERFFSINHENGEVYFKAQPYAGNYNIKIIARATGDDQRERIDQKDVSITVTQNHLDTSQSQETILDNYLVFTSPTFASVDTRHLRDLLHSVHAYDPAGGDIEYFFAHHQMGYFDLELTNIDGSDTILQVDESTGAFSFAEGSYRKPVRGGVDYFFDVFARSTSDESKIAKATINIRLTSNRPSYDESIVFVDKYSPLSQRFSQEQDGIKVVNVDFRANSTKTFYIPVAYEPYGLDIIYSIDPQSEDVDKFAINPNTGKLTFVTSQSEGDYKVNIIATPTDRDGQLITITQADGTEISINSGASSYRIETLIVNVKATEDLAPYFVSEINPSFTIPPDFDATQPIYRASAIDVDDTHYSDFNIISYALENPNQADARFFTIDQETGILRFRVAPDSHKGGLHIYRINIIAQSKGVSGVEQQVKKEITLTELYYEQPPQITSDGGTISIDENNNGDTIIYHAQGQNAENQPLIWSLKAGYYSEFFAIDKQSGILTTIGSPDYEKPFGYYGSEEDFHTLNQQQKQELNTYQIRVFVNIGSLELNNQDYVDLTITVSPIDELPAFISPDEGFFSSSLPVNIAQTVYVAKMKYDFGDINRYRLETPEQGDERYFDINRKTGEVTFKPDIRVDNQDGDGDNIYEITVIADSTGSTGIVSTLSKSVLIYAEVAPAFNVDSYSYTVAENNIDFVANAQLATHRDGFSVSYSLADITNRDDAQYFDVDANTGAITFKSTPDYEAPFGVDAPSTLTPDDLLARNTYSFNLIAGIKAHLGLMQQSYSTVTITVEDMEVEVIHESPRTEIPIVEAPILLFDPRTPELPITEIEETIEYTVTENDDDFFVDNIVAFHPMGYEISYFMSDYGESDDGISDAENSQHAQYFHVNFETGYFSFYSPPDYENHFSGQNSLTDYYVRFSAVAIDENGIESAPSFVRLLFHIENVEVEEDLQPRVLKGDYFDVYENSPIGSAVYGAKANDTNSQPITWSLSGPDERYFSIDTTTGLVSLRQIPDRESIRCKGELNAGSIYTVILTASSGPQANRQTDSREVEINVLPADEPPVFSSAIESIFYANAADSDTVIYKAQLEYDCGDVNRFSFGDPDTGDEQFFDIDHVSGEVTLKNPLSISDVINNPQDSNSDNVYEVGIVVLSIGLSGEEYIIDRHVMMTLAVREVELSPVFGQGNLEFYVMEAPFSSADAGAPTQPEGYVVLYFDDEIILPLATHPDGYGISYSLADYQGNGDGNFFSLQTRVDNNGGVSNLLLFNEEPDYENPFGGNGADNLYQFNLIATATSPVPLRIETEASVLISVNVLDNSVAPSFAQGRDEFLYYVQENNANFATTANLASHREGNPITYSMEQQDGNTDLLNYFNIDSASGVITFTSAPDYENPFGVSDPSTLGASELKAKNIYYFNLVATVSSIVGGTTLFFSDNIKVIIAVDDIAEGTALVNFGYGEQQDDYVDDNADGSVFQSWIDGG